jgi:hypothetical protein
LPTTDRAPFLIRQDLEFRGIFSHPIIPYSLEGMDYGRVSSIVEGMTTELVLYTRGTQISGLPPLLEW